jgi:hypothetical protein
MVKPSIGQKIRASETEAKRIVRIQDKKRKIFERIKKFGRLRR